MELEAVRATEHYTPGCTRLPAVMEKAEGVGEAG